MNGHSPASTLAVRLIPCLDLHEGCKRLLSLVEQSAEACFMPLIVSGAVARLDDLLAAKAQAHRGFDGIISGPALYDGRLDPKQALEALAA